ncbi:MAG: HNH endonuclease [Dehalococcoidia bacterium]|nr:HNH endonuclease [Dehalococcoidia bacterium]
MLQAQVLVLNLNYEPLNVCKARRALILLERGKAEVVENATTIIRSATRVFRIPSVIRLLYLIKRPRLFRRKLSRREIFLRDGYACQYCGVQNRELTLDHVIPRHMGGPHDWENLVSACVPCNHRKAGLTPQQARMRLRRSPSAPRATPYQLIYQYLRAQEDWRKFVPGWERELAVP